MRGGPEGSEQAAMPKNVTTVIEKVVTSDFGRRKNLKSDGDRKQRRSAEL